MKVARAEQVASTKGPASRMRAALALFAAAIFVFAAACYGSYRLDCSRLSAIAKIVTAKEATPERRVLGLLRWVHANGRSTANEQYFLLKRFGATPMQVLEGGGDCADKSRLLSAMLREIGIPSTMLMCFDEGSGKSTHTVVEARVGDAGYMVVDPAYNIAFPGGDGGGYHGLLALRRDRTILPRRLDELIEQRGRHSSVRSYDRNRAAFGSASSINWNKNVLTRTTGDLLSVELGVELYRLPRPRALEEPKLAIAVLALGFSGFFVLLCLRLGRAVRPAVGAAVEGTRPNKRDRVPARSKATMQFGSYSPG